MQGHVLLGFRYESLPTVSGFVPGAPLSKLTVPCWFTGFTGCYRHLQVREDKAGGGRLRSQSNNRPSVLSGWKTEELHPTDAGRIQRHFIGEGQNVKWHVASLSVCIVKYSPPCDFKAISFVLIQFVSSNLYDLKRFCMCPLLIFVFMPLPLLNFICDSHFNNKKESVQTSARDTNSVVKENLSWLTDPYGEKSFEFCECLCPHMKMLYIKNIVRNTLF